MDPRVEEHADVLVEYSTDISEGDLVLVQAPPAAEDLTVALYEKIGERGGTPTSASMSSRAFRAYLMAVDPEAVRTPEHALAQIREADVMFQVMGGRNSAELSDVSPEAMQAQGRIMEPIMDELVEGDLDHVLTQHPTPSAAQKAEMSTAAYADFVYDAIVKDWAELEAFIDNMAEILEDGSEVRIVSGEETDVTMSIAGNHGENDCGGQNMPCGEAYTVPIPDSVEGTVRFDRPLIRQGREVHGASLAFENGEVVDHDAEQNAEVLETVLGTDDGARRLGELGIGMNRSIDRFTYTMLFDEKMGDTVHMALGRTISEAVGEDNPENESGIHMDMIVDMSEDSRIEVDGEVVQRDGTFRFEDGFEA